MITLHFHFILSYLKTLSVGPVEVWTCDLPDGSLVLYQLSWPVVVENTSFLRQFEVSIEHPYFRSDFPQPYTISAVGPFIPSKPVFVSECQVWGENRHFKFVLTEISTLSPRRAFVVENTSFLHQFKVSIKHRHVRSFLTQTSTY